MYKIQTKPQNIYRTRKTFLGNSNNGKNYNLLWRQNTKSNNKFNKNQYYKDKNTI